jgi:aminoglycoside/choline kinase family phosphotransferase
MSDYSNEPRLSHWIEQWLSKNRIVSPIRLEQLAGDGSQRAFYRLSYDENSRVLLSDSAWDLSRDYPAHQAYLKNRGLPVPEFFEIDEKAGFLVMEDLGDLHLQKRLLAEPSRKMGWLAQATELLAKLHGSAYPVPPELPISTRRFDAAKYSQELLFTYEHLHQGFLKLPAPAPRIKEGLIHFCEALSKITPDVFAHRDYHCRNLMLHDERLYLIDFQDARLGSPQYDLASLIFDAYVPITPKERETLVALYRTSINRFPVGNRIDWTTFNASLNAVALQRVVKAAGSFASFFTRYGKTTHLPYLKPSFENLRWLLQSRPGIPPEAEMLFPVEQWAARMGEIHG